MDSDEIQRVFGVSEHGNFMCVDTIPVPHPDCITPHHVVWASENFGGLLSKQAIEAAERQNTVKYACDICKARHRKLGEKILGISDHGEALIVACKVDYRTHKEAEQELRTYLIMNKGKCEEHKFVGFSFMRWEDWEKCQVRKKR